MSTAEPIDDLISNAPPLAPPNDEASSSTEPPFAHRHLRDDAFWREIPAFSDVSEEEFLDTTWQMRHSIYGEDQLIEMLEQVAPDAFVDDVRKGFHEAPMTVRITPYIFSLIDWDHPRQDPLRLQFLPISSRLSPDHPMLTLDSLGEQEDAPVEGLTHRYPDKALFLVLDTCPVYCRFCTRSYAVGVDTDTVDKENLRVDPERWERAFDYIEAHPELEDLVISGGDTSNMPAKYIREIGERLLNIDHVRRIRYASKGPAVMPMKILTDDDWVEALADVHEMGQKRHKEVALHTHFNHPREITEITRRAMDRLFEEGIRVRNQCVLQRGVNDDPETMKLLTRRLGEVNVQPYYVYQHDMVEGVEDLRTSIRTNLELEKEVRGITAGFNTAMHIVDAPGGGGKRDVHSYEYYDRDTGISVYTAPSVKPDEYFMYFDPLHSLSEEMQQTWQDPDERDRMCNKAIEAARANR